MQWLEQGLRGLQRATYVYPKVHISPKIHSTLQYYVDISSGFYPGTFWGGGKLPPPNLATSPQEFLASSDFLDNCLYTNILIIFIQSTIFKIP